MTRHTRVLVLLAPALGALVLFAAACGGSAGAEQQVLTNFFRAARVRDNVTLANVSAVSFDPRTDGSVQSFEIVSVGEEQRRQVQIQQLAQEEETAKQADSDFSMKKRAYQNENIDAIQRVVKAEAEKQTLTGKDAEIQAEWTKWRNEQSQSTKRVSEARAKAANERGVAVSSLTAPGQPDADVSAMEIELVRKDVTVDAQVQSPEGQTAPKTLVVTLQRAVGKTGADTKEGRWLITNIKGGAAPTS